MKNFLYTISLLFIATINAQTKTEEMFVFKNDTLHYTKWESKTDNSIAFINVFTENESSRQIIAKGLKGLKGNYYFHTAAYFLELPKHYTQDMKEVAFNEFFRHIYEKDKLEEYSYYLNFDTDYSSIFSNNKKSYTPEIIIKRKKTNITLKNIRKGLEF